MAEHGTSFFGPKIDGMVANAKEVAATMNFTNKVEDTINDLWSIIGMSIDSVVESCNRHSENGNKAENSDHFMAPTINDHLEDTDDLSEPTQLSVDDLIAESYTYGKTDEQIADEFLGDLRSTVKQYAWVLVAIGIALDHEEKKALTEILKIKSNQLQQMTKDLNEREIALNRKG